MNHKNLPSIYRFGLILGITAVAVFALSVKMRIWSLLAEKFSLALVLPCVLLICISICVYIFILYRFEGSINQIIKIIQRVQNDDDLTARCECKKNNLIGKVASSINGLIDAIEKRSNESAELHSEISSIIKNIPGGMFRCKSDENLTIMFVNKGFINLLGYTEDDLVNIYQNRYINLVHKDDRAMLRETLESQRLTTETINAVYRVYHSEGGFRWVHQQGSFMIDDNGTWHDNVVIDVTEQKKAQDAHLASESRYRLVMQATSDWICEFDLTNNRLLMDNRSISNILPIEACESYDSAFNYVLNNLIYPEDRNMISNIFNREVLLEEFKDAKSEVAVEFRSLESDGNYIWSSVTIIPVIDTSNNSIYCIAYFRNVNERKNAELALMKKAQSDSLTHLYNNETTQSLISNYLLRDGKEGKHALLVLDIDDFKHINDNWGHLFGDAVLRSASKQMKQLFRNTDVLGRIGGDEFVIFLKNIGSNESILEKSQELLRIFCNSFTDSKRGCCISGSIGISFYPQHGTTYTELMDHADRALYHAKDAGKNGCVVYDEEETSKSVQKSSNMDSSCSQKHGFNIDNVECILMAYVFKQLFEATDVDTSIKTVLQMIGEHYRASQVYVFFNADGENPQSYDWCDTKTPLTKQQILEFVSNDSMCPCYPLFKQEGIFYCDDISKLPEPLYNKLSSQNINFVMQFSIQQNGVIQGIAGIASSRDDICLTQSEIDTLDILSRVIHLILIKRKEK